MNVVGQSTVRYPETNMLLLGGVKGCGVLEIAFCRGFGLFSPSGFWCD